MFWSFSVSKFFATIAASSSWVLCVAPSLHAQLVPDATLPSPSIVTDIPGGQRITGGTQAGANLFHSFREFVIPSDTRVDFAGVAELIDGTGSGVAIERIFSRVTGEQAATLNGTLATPNNVSFYLIAPNGVIFGDQARLDVGRDFGVTTGNGVTFDDGRIFGLGAIETPSLLSVGVPLGLGLGSVGTGDIVNRSRATDDQGAVVGLQVGAGHTMEFVGHDLQFEGGFATAVDGQIRLRATDAIAVTHSGQVDVSGETGGTITISANAFATIDSSKVLADALADSFQNGLDTATNPDDPTASRTGLITVMVDRLAVQNNALISTSTFGSHPGGTINVTANSVALTGTDVLENVLPRLFALEVIENPDQIGSGLFAMSLGAGNAGTLNLQANDLSLDRSAFMSTVTTSAGNGGTLNVNADQIALRNSEIFADTYGAGNGGIVNLNADFIRLDIGGGIFASAFQSGRGGLVNVTADRIEIDGTTANGQINSGIGSNVFSSVVTVGGLVTINAREIDISNGGSIGAGTFGPARGGTIILRATESINLAGVSDNGLSQSAITTQSRGTGEAGDIELTTGRLSITGGASVFTSALAAGPAGRLTARATESIELSGRTPDGQFPSSLRADAEVAGAPSGFFSPSPANVVGAAGDMTVVTPELVVRDGATLVVNSIGEGEQAGNLFIRADRLQLDTGATIEAETAAATEGNITITADTVQLQSRSGISSNATGIATGGSITIQANTVVGLNNSDITANAQTGSGGQVTIEAAGVFGLTFRDQLTPLSDITATSDLGLQSSGTVSLISPDVQLDQGLLDTPKAFAGVDQVEVDACRSRGRNNRFTVVGRQGQPDAPDVALRGEVSVITPHRLHHLPEAQTSQDAENLPPTSTQRVDPRGEMVEANRIADREAFPPLLEATQWTRTEVGYTLSAPSTLRTSPDWNHGSCTDRAPDDNAR
ncbi:MAG: S-layer family protein [Oscillatoriales cyanobacterium]|nr:MAG: S-layer family protein [Oscillatoriales cyanobacterium]